VNTTEKERPPHFRSSQVIEGSEYRTQPPKPVLSSQPVATGRPRLRVTPGRLSSNRACDLLTDCAGACGCRPLRQNIHAASNSSTDIPLPSPRGVAQI